MHTAERERADMLEARRTLPLEDTSLADIMSVAASEWRRVMALAVVSLAGGA